MPGVAEKSLYLSEIMISPNATLDHVKQLLGWGYKHTRTHENGMLVMSREILRGRECQCDGEYDGETGRWVRTNRFCEEHDYCHGCEEEGTLGASRLRLNGEFLCNHCWETEQAAAKS